MKLCRGKGSEKERRGCWMVAASMYEHGTWSDQPACVPPTIRALCIALNDMLPDAERENVIGPHLFTPIGCDPSVESEIERARICGGYAKEWAARAARAAEWAAEAAGAAGAARAAEWAARAARDAEWAAEAAEAAEAAGAAEWAAGAAEWAAGAARDAMAAGAAGAARDAEAARAAEAHQSLLQCILECCAVGRPGQLIEQDITRVRRIVADWV